jgi:hypothetical protein
MTELTPRGFQYSKFQDANSKECSIQISSDYREETLLWLGLKGADPVIMATKAKEYGIETEETTGWIPYSIPSDVLLNTRMHLTQSQVKELIPILEYFVEHGNLPD